MKTCAIVILFNPTKEVVDNINTYRHLVDFIFLIDNSENDNSVLFLDIQDQSLTYYSLFKNYGIAKALNIGMGFAIQKNCSWVLTMDQDSKFINNVIHKYLLYIQQNRSEKIAILAPTYITERSTPPSRKNNKKLKFVMQSANFINCEAYKSIGEFEEKLFIDCVDFDYCYRSRKKGYSIIQCADSYVYHTPGITKSKQIFNFKVKYGYASSERYYYQARNLFYLFKNYGDPTMLFLMLFKLAKSLLLFHNPMEYRKAIFLGIKDCNNNIFGSKKESDKLRNKKNLYN